MLRILELQTWSTFENDILHSSLKVEWVVPVKAVAFPSWSHPHILGIPAGHELLSVLNKYKFTFFFPSLWVVLSHFHWQKQQERVIIIYQLFRG